MQKQILKQFKNEDGLTLIDIAVILIIIGILLYPFLQSRRLSLETAKQGSTIGAILVINKAIEAYYLENKYYPCPANPAIGPNTIVAGAAPVQFGEENRLPPVAPATVGLCVTDAGNNALPNPGDTAYSGAVPFKTLKLTLDESLDAWNNKLEYVVSATQTHPATFSPNGGAITLEKSAELFPHPETNIPVCTATDDEDPLNPTPLIPSPRNHIEQHLVVFSHGYDGLGAYDVQGNSAGGCLAGGNETQDSENCDSDSTFRLPSCLSNTIPGANFYDDVFTISAESDWKSVPSVIWDTAQNPNDLGSVVGYIGIGNPNPQHHVDVNGNILSDTVDGDPNKKGNVHASTYCEKTGTNCFDPKTISGDDPNMTCSDGSGMGGIGSNKAKCTNKLPVGKESSCPEGKSVKGLKANGEVKCG